MAQKAAAEAEARREQSGKLFRFWMKEKEEARITFVDGELSKEGALTGYLDPPRYYEHNLFLNGQWNNFYYCPEKTNPDANDKCPICESGDKPALVACSPSSSIPADPQHKDKTKVWKDQEFSWQAQTFKLLTKHALKLAGLAVHIRAGGWGKSAAVGSMFDFVEKHHPTSEDAMVERTQDQPEVKMPTSHPPSKEVPIVRVPG
jgi:hypothetical protein